MKYPQNKKTAELKRLAAMKGRHSAVEKKGAMRIVRAVSAAKVLPPEPTNPNEIFAKWEPLAYKFTAGWNIPGYAKEDLQQEARIAIYRCATVFNPERGCFFGVAKQAIRNHLSSLLSRAKALKRVGFVTSLDAELLDGETQLHETLADTRTMDSSLPCGVAIREAIQEHIKLQQGLPARLRNRRIMRSIEKDEYLPMAETLRLVSEAYGVETNDLGAGKTC